MIQEEEGQADTYLHSICIQEYRTDGGETFFCSLQTLGIRIDFGGFSESRTGDDLSHP